MDKMRGRSVDDTQKIWRPGKRHCVSVSTSQLPFKFVLSFVDIAIDLVYDLG